MIPIGTNNSVVVNCGKIAKEYVKQSKNFEQLD